MGEAQGLATPLWQPVGDVPKYGIVSLLLGTLKVVLVGMGFAVPVSVLAAVYTSEFAPARNSGRSVPPHPAVPRRI